MRKIRVKTSWAQSGCSILTTLKPVRPSVLYIVLNPSGMLLYILGLAYRKGGLDGWGNGLTCFLHFTISRGQTKVWVIPQERIPPTMHLE